MSIKAVDFQVMLPKTSEVSRQSSDEQHKSIAAHQLQSQSTHDKADASLRQVYAQDKTPNARIKEKQEKDQGRRKEEKKKNKKGNDIDNKSTIDIRL